MPCTSATKHGLLVMVGVMLVTGDFKKGLCSQTLRAAKKKLESRKSSGAQELPQHGQLAMLVSPHCSGRSLLNLSRPVLASCQLYRQACFICSGKARSEQHKLHPQQTPPQAHLELITGRTAQAPQGPVGRVLGVVVLPLELLRAVGLEVAQLARQQVVVNVRLLPGGPCKSPRG